MAELHQPSPIPQLHNSKLPLLYISLKQCFASIQTKILIRSLITRNNCDLKLIEIRQSLA